MDSDTTVAEESDQMSVVSETTVGSINSPLTLNLLSKFKDPARPALDSTTRNSAPSPSIPYQNFNIANFDADFYKNTTDDEDEDGNENSQSLLSEKCKTVDLSNIKSEHMACGLEYNHSSEFKLNSLTEAKIPPIPMKATFFGGGQVNIPKEEKISDTDLKTNHQDHQILDNKAIADTLNDIMKSVENDYFLLLTHRDHGTPKPYLKTKEIQLSPFTGFDSEIYPEYIPTTNGSCKPSCSNDSPNTTTEMGSPDFLDIYTHGVSQYDNAAIFMNSEINKEENKASLSVYEKNHATATVVDTYVNVNRSLISPTVLNDVEFDDETQVPISNDQVLNIPVIFDKVANSCKKEGHEVQAICSEDCHQVRLHTPTGIDLKVAQDNIQVSSPQFSFVSDQSTEICRLEIRADTIDIADSQPSRLVDKALDYPTSECSIETAIPIDQDVTNLLVLDQKEKSLGLDNDFDPNLQPGKSEERDFREKRVDLETNESFLRKMAIVGDNLQPRKHKDRELDDQVDQETNESLSHNRNFDSSEKINPDQFPSSPVSCASESLLCTKRNDIESDKNIIQVNSKKDSMEERFPPIDTYNQVNGIREPVVLSDTVVASASSLIKGVSGHDNSQLSNNHQPLIKERVVSIEVESDKGSDLSKEVVEIFSNENRNLSVTADTRSSNSRSPENFVQPTINQNSTSSLAKYVLDQKMGSAKCTTTNMLLANQEPLLKEDSIFQKIDSRQKASSEITNRDSKLNDSLKNNTEHISISSKETTSPKSFHTNTADRENSPKQLQTDIQPTIPLASCSIHKTTGYSERSLQHHQYSHTGNKSKFPANFKDLRSEVDTNEDQQKNTPEESLRRSGRESKQPIRFSSPEEHIQPKAVVSETQRGNKQICRYNSKTGTKKQKIPIKFINSKVESSGKTHDLDNTDDFEMHQEKLNTYIQIEMQYGQLLDDMKRNQPNRENFNICSSQFKTLQPQLMKLLAESKFESQTITSKTLAGSDKSTLKTRIKLLAIRQKKLKGLFDKHCRVQSTLRILKSNLTKENTTNLIQMSFSQSTTSSKNSKRCMTIPPFTPQTRISLTKESPTRQEYVLNPETGLFEFCSQRQQATPTLRPGTLTNMVSNVKEQSKCISAVNGNFSQKTSSNLDDLQNIITRAPDPRSSALPAENGKSHYQISGNHPRKIVCIPVTKVSDGRNLNATAFGNINEENGNSKRPVTQKFVPPTRTILVKVGNTGSKDALVSTKVWSGKVVSLLNDIGITKPQLPIHLPKSNIITPTSQGPYHQVINPTSNDDEILDIILRSLDKETNESKVPIPVNTPNAIPRPLSPQHQDESDSNGFEFDNEIVDSTMAEQIVHGRTGIDEPHCKIKRLDRLTNLPAIGSNKQATPQQGNTNLVQNLPVSLHLSAQESNDSRKTCFDQLCCPGIQPSMTTANNQVPAKPSRRTSPYLSPCRSVVSFKSGFSTSSTKYLMKMKSKALKITQAKTVRDYRTALGSVPYINKRKQFPSLKRMIDTGLLKSGKDKLSINLKGHKVTASLVNSGLIINADGQSFSTTTKWLSHLTGTQMTLKAKAYRMVCYENTPLMEFKKQYDKLESNNTSSQTNVNIETNVKQVDESKSANRGPMFNQTRSNTVPTTWSITPAQIKTTLPTRCDNTALPVRYQVTGPTNQYPHQIPNQIHGRFTTPISVLNNRPFFKVATNSGPIAVDPLMRNQYPLDQRSLLIQSVNLRAEKDADDSNLRSTDPHSILKEEIRTMLMKSVNVLLVNDSELVYYPDITEEFWVKPFKDVDISKELWQQVDAW